MKSKIIVGVLVLLAVGAFVGCEPDTSDTKQQDAQEKILQDITAQAGMPAIKNGREKKLLKLIFEMRDKNISTYTYMYSNMSGKLIYLGQSIGYGIPYATQYSNPEKVEYHTGDHAVLPQADPNGLFSPSSAAGTWVLLKDPNSEDVKPIYVEPEIVVTPFKIPQAEYPAGTK